MQKLFRPSEVRPPRYTGHLVWHGLLARCLLYTKLEMRPLAILYNKLYALAAPNYSFSI